MELDWIQKTLSKTLPTDWDKSLSVAILINGLAWRVS